MVDCSLCPITGQCVKPKLIHMSIFVKVALCTTEDKLYMKN